MKEIKWLVAQIEEELHDADNYTHKAANYHDADPELSRTCAELARQELQHADMLHGHAVRLINDYRQQHGDPPAVMQSIWDWEHEKIVEHTQDIKSRLNGL